jgi:hypothetical protein
MPASVVCRADAQVIVVEDENGNIVRETMKDTDTLARYKTMHETLVYLSHLDHDDTEKQMLDKLRLQARMRHDRHNTLHAIARGCLFPACIRQVAGPSCTCEPCVKRS